MTMTTAVASKQRRPAFHLDEGDHTLAGEHAVLLRDVRRRTAPVLALAAARTWPAEELHTLIRYLRIAVLRQVSDEEQLLFPGDRTAAPFAELSTEHVRLHVLTQRLTQLPAGPGSLPALTASIKELLTTLERHLIDEQAVLAALPGAPKEIPGTAVLAAGSTTWPAPPGTTLILLDTLPSEQAVQLSIERLLRMRPGETAEVRSTNAIAIRQLWDWMRCYDTVGYGFSHTQTGPAEWQLQVTRRRTA